MSTENCLASFCSGAEALIGKNDGAKRLIEMFATTVRGPQPANEQ